MHKATTTNGAAFPFKHTLSYVLLFVFMLKYGEKKELYVYACCAMPDDEYWLANWLVELTRWINGWMTGYMAWSRWKLDLKAFRF